ncbi:MAG: hypothetical protein HZB53_19360 [Chloroflexi bacterium]|nr:hypothetical protein [Chloroflexota bacterium]
MTELQQIRAILERERRRIADEICHYPPPIARCDAQFNGLLEERAAVAQALYDLDAIARGGSAPNGLRAFVDAVGGDVNKKLWEVVSIVSSRSHEP